MADFQFLPDDLAPGDQRMLPLDFSPLRNLRIASPSHPQFREAYDRLWTQFGAAHEMESMEIIADRLNWQPVCKVGDRWLRYEMALVRKGTEFVAVRDHIAIVSVEGGTARAVVHMSHVLVDPEWRRTGVAAWLRAVPIQTARACLEAAGFSPESDIILVAEMEHIDPRDAARMIRLRAYEKAGFRKIDPEHADYHQPDFRPPAEIDASGGPRPLPFGLLVRRLGKEEKHSMPMEEARHVVGSLYHMYATGFRAQDMNPLWRSLEQWTTGPSQIQLVPPTSTVGLDPGL